MNKHQQSLLATVNMSIFICMLMVITACTPAEVATGTEKAKTAVEALKQIAGKASPTDAERKFGGGLQAKIFEMLKRGGLPPDVTRELMRLLTLVERLNLEIVNLPFVED